MCIAILQPKGKEVSSECLEESWKSNPDGAGLAYSENGVLKIYKELYSFDNFYKEYREVMERAKSNMLVHFRIGTSGEKDEINCHPHIANSDMVVIHNGIFRCVDVPKDSPISDTAIFTRDIIQPLYNLNPNFMECELVTKMLEHYIGTNKVVLMNAKGDYRIINEKQGHWEDGIWYSNYSYRVSHGRKTGFYTTSTTKGITIIAPGGYMEDGKFYDYSVGGNHSRLYAIYKKVRQWPNITQYNEYGYTDDTGWKSFAAQESISKWKFDDFIKENNELAQSYKSFPDFKEIHEVRYNAEMEEEAEAKQKEEAEEKEKEEKRKNEWEKVHKKWRRKKPNHNDGLVEACMDYCSECGALDNLRDLITRFPAKPDECENCGYSKPRKKRDFCTVCNKKWKYEKWDACIFCLADSVTKDKTVSSYSVKFWNGFIYCGNPQCKAALTVKEIKNGICDGCDGYVNDAVDVLKMVSDLYYPAGIATMHEKDTVDTAEIKTTESVDSTTWCQECGILLLENEALMNEGCCEACLALLYSSGSPLEEQVTCSVCNGTDLRSYETTNGVSTCSPCINKKFFDSTRNKDFYSEGNYYDY
jgi:glutamine amidotransferase